MKRWFTGPRLILLSIALVLFAAWFVEQVSADRYREPIRAALENALGRKVEIGLVSFRLLPMPGFTVKDVSIGEDPAVGPEPTAYVTTLRVRPTISALLGGPARLRLRDSRSCQREPDARGPRPNGRAVEFFVSDALQAGSRPFPGCPPEQRANQFQVRRYEIDLLPAGDGCRSGAAREGGWPLDPAHARPARTHRPARARLRLLRGRWRMAYGAMARLRST